MGESASEKEREINRARVSSREQGDKSINNTITEHNDALKRLSLSKLEY
jgi:hypothetical protein